MPNKVGEYLSQGLPMVSCLRGSVAELLAQHQVGLTFREGDTGHLREQLGRLEEEPGLHESMATNGRELFAAQFDAEQVYGQIAELLAELAEERA